MDTSHENREQVSRAHLPRVFLKVHCVASVGRNPHLFSDWVCESAVGDAAVGDIVRHEAARGSDSSTRPSGNNSCRSWPSVRSSDAG
jgi:hypothetical protein